MAEPKTRPTEVPVADFIAAIENPGRRADAETVQALFAAVTGESPVMWGPSIVGFGTYRAASGDWPIIGFSPRKAQLVLYLMDQLPDRAERVARMGKVTTKGGCLYVTKLANVDMAELRDLATASVAWMRETHPAA